MGGEPRLAQLLEWLGAIKARAMMLAVRLQRRPSRRPAVQYEPSQADLVMRRWLGPLLRLPIPRGAGVAASVLIIGGSATFGIIRGNHVDEFFGGLRDVRDELSNAAGLRVVSIALSGHRQITREEVLAIAGITGRSSLLFLDVDAAREKLKANPWIADATLLKLYPDRLQIGITERRPYALWQKNGHVSVIARDGTILEPYVAQRFTRLPLVVGQGAETRVEAVLAMLDRHPDIRDQVKASIFVGERRWNLRLRNGIDVRLPEADPDRALDKLQAFDRDKKLLSRDITAIDMRLDDRVTVRLSDAAAQARADAIKSKAKKKPGSDA